MVIYPRIEGGKKKKKKKKTCSERDLCPELRSWCSCCCMPAHNAQAEYSACPPQFQTPRLSAIRGTHMGVYMSNKKIKENNSTNCLSYLLLQQQPPRGNRAPHLDRKPCVRSSTKCRAVESCRLQRVPFMSTFVSESGTTWRDTIIYTGIQTLFLAGF